MGRMFRIITEGNLDFPPAGPALAVADGEPFVQGGAPFIEVGGPTGVVHSLPKPTTRIPAVVEPVRRHGVRRQIEVREIGNHGQHPGSAEAQVVEFLPVVLGVAEPQPAT